MVPAVSTSITPEERLEAIRKAKDTFHHDVQSVHDDEMANGADAALAKHLTFLVYLSSKSDENLLNEIALTLEAMESLYRASSHIVGASFKRMGNELLKLLITIMNDEVCRRQTLTTAAGTVDGSLREDDPPSLKDEKEKRPPTPPAVDSSIEGDLLLRKVTKILGHFARVGDATHPLAHFPGLLGSLVNLVTLRPYESTPWEARLSALWTLANLACNAENMEMMACTQGLVYALIEIACRPLHPSDPVETTVEILRSRNISSRAILNLSWEPVNKVLLAENASLVDLLTDLIVCRSEKLDRSNTMQDILVATRRHAAGALRNLAAAPRRIKIGLCSYKNGHILDALTDAALNDQDNAVKDRAFACIHNLAIHDTAQNMVSRPALVLALKDVLLSDDASGTGDSNRADGTPKEHASATLLVLERTITPNMDSYDNLKDLLEAIKHKKRTEGVNKDMAITNSAAV